MDKKLIAMISRDPEGYAADQTLTRLKDLLRELDYAYHDKNKSLVPDSVYDALRDAYDARAKKPYAKVGAVSSHAARRVKLLVPMGSLSKLKPGSKALGNFLAKGPFVVSNKEDGISLSLIYENGALSKAHQRGDGTVGTDSSGVIPSLNVPHKIPVKETFIVRIEFTMNTSTFAKYFSTEKGGVYETARNGAGGLLNKNKPDPMISKVKCVAHEILMGPNARVAPSKQFAFLKRLGFHVVPHKVFPKLNETILGNLLTLRKAKSLREIDGIVVAQDRPYEVHGKYPTHAFAFKVNDLEASVVVKVKDVEWNESRYGRLAPRIIIEPTKIGGVTVQHFTGHNAFYIEHGYTSKLKGSKIPYAPRPIGKGATVRAVRSGDVIPYIVEVIKPAKKPAQPSIPFNSDGTHYYAVTGGDDKAAKSLVNFFNVMEVEGLKRGTIDILVEHGFDTVRKISRIKASDLDGIPGIGHTKAVTLERNIKAALAKNATLPKLAAGSTVFGDKFGESRLTALFKEYPNILESGWSIRRMTDEFMTIPGFKQLAITAAENMPKFIKFLERTKIPVVQMKTTKVVGKAMEGKSILFTSVRDKALAEWIVANGGKLASSVKSANLLIVKDELASNNKTEYALENNIPIMSVGKFKTKYKVPS